MAPHNHSRISEALTANNAVLLPSIRVSEYNADNLLVGLFDGPFYSWADRRRSKLRKRPQRLITQGTSCVVGFCGLIVPCPATNAMSEAGAKSIMARQIGGPFHWR